MPRYSLKPQKKLSVYASYLDSFDDMGRIGSSASNSLPPVDSKSQDVSLLSRTQDSPVRENVTSKEKRNSSKIDSEPNVQEVHSTSRRRHRKSQESSQAMRNSVLVSVGEAESSTPDHHYSVMDHQMISLRSADLKLIHTGNEDDDKPQSNQGSLDKKLISTGNEDGNKPQSNGNQGSMSCENDESSSSMLSRDRPQPSDTTTNGEEKESRKSRKSLKRLSSKQEPPKPDPPDPKWEAAFDLLKVDGELHHDLISHALLLTCQHVPDPHWISDALRMTHGASVVSTVDLTQFCTFIRNYEAIEKTAAQEEFAKYDYDQSGSVDRKELANLLQTMLVTPLPGVLDEVLAAVDLDGSGDLSVDEFVKVLRLMKNRGGFTDAETTALHTVFKKYDKDRSGEIDATELEQMLAWLGYPVTAKRAQALVREADSDGSGCLCEPEFMLVMRKFRNGEIGVFQEAFEAFSIGGCIQIEDFSAIFSKLGYRNLVPGVLEELRSDIGSTAGAPIDFNTAWRMMQLFRARNGHSREDLKELQEVFQRFATAQTEFDEGVSLSEVELGLVLRWLGFSPMLTWLQDLITENDADGSCELELSEFLKLMRRLREAELKAVQQVFDQESDTNGMLPVTVLRRILTELNYLPSLSLLKPVLQDYGASHADFQTLLRLLDQFRQNARTELRKNMGFNANEVRQYEQQFQAYTKNKNGDGIVDGRQLARLLEQLAPQAATDKKAHKQIAQVLSEVIATGDGGLTFPKFLQLMQVLSQKVDKQKLVKEQRAASGHFSRVEVKDLREVFRLYAVLGELDMVNLRQLLRRFMRLGEGCQLLTNLEDLVEAADEDKNGTLDFPEFLSLLRRMQETNFGKINDIAAATAASLEHDAQSRSSSKQSVGHFPL